MKISFHLVEASLWPLFISLSIFTSMINFLMTLRGWNFIFFFITQLTLYLTLYVWWRDVTREGLMQGAHSLSVEEGLKKGFMLFIISEVMFFFSFFWSFFQFSLAPTMELGSCWPPTQLLFLDSLGVPLLNTIILLSSGVLVTMSHHSLLTLNHPSSYISLMLGLTLGAIFTALQGIEYMNTSFTMMDSAMGTCFYVMTGFHGLHVLIGSTFILVILIRMIMRQFSNTHHSGFEMSAWYWHFVDVVWIFLFIFVYLWGSNLF